MQPQAVSGSDLSLSKDFFFNLGFNTLKVNIYLPSGIYPHRSRLQTQTRFLKSLSCDLEPDTTMPTYRNIFVLSYLDPYLSAGIDTGRGIS